MLLLERVCGAAQHFDVVHFHIDYLHFPLSRRLHLSQLTTLHGRLDLPDLVPVYREFPDMPLVSISDHQRGPLPWVNWCRTIYHGLPRDLAVYANFGDKTIEVTLTLEVGADFADIFEVRGAKRSKRGRFLEPQLTDAELALSYEGLDGVRRTSRIRCSPAPKSLSESQIDFLVRLRPDEEQHLEFSIACEKSEPARAIVDFQRASSGLSKDIEQAAEQDCAIRGMHFTPDYPTSCGWPVRLPRRCWTISE